MDIHSWLVWWRCDAFRCIITAPRVSHLAKSMSDCTCAASCSIDMQMSRLPKLKRMLVIYMMGSDTRNSANDTTGFMMQRTQCTNMDID